MNKPVGDSVSLTFSLDVEDGWPPLGAESLPFLITDKGYVASAPPLFVKDLSVGDTIDVNLGINNVVQAWKHVARSRHTTIWILRMRNSATIELVLARLRALHCNTASLANFGTYAVDVPPSVSIDAVDYALAQLDTDAAAVAFPSMRHIED